MLTSLIEKTEQEIGEWILESYQRRNFSPIIHDRYDESLEIAVGRFYVHLDEKIKNRFKKGLALAIRGCQDRTLYPSLVWMVSEFDSAEEGIIAATEVIIDADIGRQDMDQIISIIMNTNTPHTIEFLRQALRKGKVGSSLAGLLLVRMYELDPENIGTNWELVRPLCDQLPIGDCQKLAEWVPSTVEELYAQLGGDDRTVKQIKDYFS